MSAALASSFVKAQSSIGKALKSSLNPHLKNKYANLESIIDVVKPALAEHGLAFLQMYRECDEGIKIETVIIHEGGEQMSCGVLTIPASKRDAQGYGSAATYARRYSLQAAFGVATEDDDGNAAAKSAPRASKPAAAPAEMIKWDQDKATAEIVSATTADALNAIYKKWSAAVHKGSDEAKYLVDTCRAKKEDIEAAALGDKA